jgi:penicillin amidase
MLLAAKKYVPLILCLGLIFLLNTPFGKLPAIGKLLDPHWGCWQSASTEFQHQESVFFPSMQDTVCIRFDAHQVPHIFARTERDALFVQGYVHARFRLWQMDITTRFASGRISEVAGSKALHADRDMRRKGMVWGAQHSLENLERDSLITNLLNAYRDGVNTYVHSLDEAHYPLEYKLMNFAPEEWSNLKTCLMMKFMADKLSGYAEDFEMTIARDVFGNEFDSLFPQHLQEEYPVIPDPVSVSQSSTPASIKPLTHRLIPWNPCATTSTCMPSETSEGIGSNNWAIAASKSKSGKPILCNDPHLPLNIPSIWYENQLITPQHNVYGVSLPGAPFVVIGFNDSISWGFTNGYRDVKDYYEVRYTNASKQAILIDGHPSPLQRHIDTIRIKGEPDFYDTINYCVYGPIQYDQRYPRQGFEHRDFAVQWLGHQGTRELMSLRLMNHAHNYTQFVEALCEFKCPHQNIAFAAANGDIALWSQGAFFKNAVEQGRFLEDGSQSINQWGSAIDYHENPHELNPARGFVLSANQINTSARFTTAYTGLFTEERAKRLTQLLSAHTSFTLQDMMQMQQDIFWQDASEILPILLQTLQKETISAAEQKSLDALQHWDFEACALAPEPIMYSLWIDSLQQALYADELGKWAILSRFPKIRQTLFLLKSVPTHPVFDNIHTPQTETLSDIVTLSFHQMATQYLTLKDKRWFVYKHTAANHLAQIPAFSVNPINIGGGKGMVNAASAKDGPSWRMIVHMTQPIEAYGIYHAGQSGNPGSEYYINRLNDWRQGNYYRILFAHQPQDIP